MDAERGGEDREGLVSEARSEVTTPRFGSRARQSAERALQVQPGLAPAPSRSSPDSSDGPFVEHHPSMLVGLLRACRPLQWAKNALVFAAPGAAGVLFHGGVLARSLFTFLCFCLVSSGTYYFNDLCDRAADRQHPRKRFRPIASGLVPPLLAKCVGVALLLAGLSLPLLLRSYRLFFLVLGYVVMTVAYSAFLKRVAVLDIATVALGFVLRAIAGGVATNLAVSKWFLIVTSFGSLFVVAGKRRAELRIMGNTGSQVARSCDYSAAFLNQVRSTASGVTIAGYCLWAFERGDMGPGAIWSELSIVPFTLAMLRYANILDTEHESAPETLMSHDRVFQMLGLLWMLVYAVGVYS